MILMSGVAFCTSLIALLCGFIPPEEIINEGLAASLGYVGFLAGGLIIFIYHPSEILRQISASAPDRSKGFCCLIARTLLGRL